MTIWDKRATLAGAKNTGFQGVFLSGVGGERFKQTTEPEMEVLIQKLLVIMSGLLAWSGNDAAAPDLAKRFPNSGGV